MRSSLTVRTAGWLAGLTAALWMAAAGSAGAVTAAGHTPDSSSSASSPASPSAAPGAGSWTVYHGDLAGRGVAATAGGVDTSSRAWTSPALDGELYGEPLVSAGRVDDRGAGDPDRGRDVAARQ